MCITSGIVMPKLKILLYIKTLYIYLNFKVYKICKIMDNFGYKYSVY